MPAPIATVVPVMPAPVLQQEPDLPNTVAVEPPCHVHAAHWTGPQEIDLGTAEGISSLEQLNAIWRDLPAQARTGYLRDIEFSISAPAPGSPEIALLPGGVVALLGPEGVRVPDPLSAVTFTEAETKRLAAALHGRQAATTLIHTPEGVISCAGVSLDRAPQTVTIVAEAYRLPKLAGRRGMPVAILWTLGGAVAWSMDVAPALIALAARVSAILAGDRAPPLPAEIWAAADRTARRDLLAVGIAALVNDLIADTVCDDLRWEIIRRCTVDAGNLALGAADVLGAVPACFQADASRRLGELPAYWRNAAALLQEAGPGHAVLGINGMSDSRRLITALGDSLAGRGAALFLETGSNPHCATVSVDSDAAVFLVRRAGPHGRIGVLMPCDDSGPVALYGLTNELALRGGADVTVAAPCWGFCHRITAANEEAGNAAWFGMGAGLDELDIIAAAEHMVV